MLLPSRRCAARPVGQGRWPTGYWDHLRTFRRLEHRGRELLGPRPALTRAVSCHARVHLLLRKRNHLSCHRVCVLDRDLLATLYILSLPSRLDRNPCSYFLRTGIPSAGNGVEVVSSSGIDIGAAVNNGGQLTVSTGGTSISASLVASGSGSGGNGRETVFSGGTASATTLSAGGNLTISSGGLAINTVVDSRTGANNGGMNVSGGGTASGTTINSGGIEFVGSGGTDIGATVTGGSFSSGNLGNLVVRSGGTDIGATVSTFGFLTVSGISISASLVGSGGRASMAVSGTASGTVVLNSGFEMVSSGGTDLGAQISGGTQSVLSGGVASGDTVFAGSQVASDGGTAINTTVSNGGTEIVLSGGTALDTTVLNGAREIVNNGGFVDTTAISGGTLEVASGGSAGAILFGDSGTLQLDSLMAFGGTISGFQTLGDQIDLQSLGFTDGVTTLSWTQLTSGANGSGTLSVSSGASVENLTLLGQYSLASFNATSDGHGGTLITDPPVSNSVAPTSLVVHQ